MFIKDLQTRISFIGLLVIHKSPPPFSPMGMVMCIYIRIGSGSENTRMGVFFG